jgi:transglutaminase-like putative cysteine protease
MNETYLQPGSFIDSTHPRVVEFAHAHAKGASERDKAVSLYYAVRDTVRYHPFQNFTLDETYRAWVCL